MLEKMFENKNADCQGSQLNFSKHLKMMTLQATYRCTAINTQMVPHAKNKQKQLEAFGNISDENKENNSPYSATHV